MERERRRKEREEAKERRRRELGDDYVFEEEEEEERRRRGRGGEGEGEEEEALQDKGPNSVLKAFYQSPGDTGAFWVSMVSGFVFGFCVMESFMAVGITVVLFSPRQAMMQGICTSARWLGLKGLNRWSTSPVRLFPSLPLPGKTALSIPLFSGTNTHTHTQTLATNLFFFSH